MTTPLPPPGGRKDLLTVDAILTPHERLRHLESLQRGDGGGDTDSFFESSSPIPFSPAVATSSPQAASGVSKSYVAALWITLGLCMLAFSGVTGFTIYNDLDKSHEQQKSIVAASDAMNDTLSLKAQERLTALNATLAQVQEQQVVFQTQQAELLNKLQEEQKAHTMALCTQLVGKGEEAGEGGYRTEFVCQAQTGWQLGGCPDKAEVVQALLGRFTSAPDGPCTDRGSPTAWRVVACPNSMDLTAPVQEAVAQAKGAPIMDTPMQLLQRGGLRGVDACPRAYKQLQIVYRCPVVDAAARSQRCMELLNQKPAAPQK